MSRPASASTLLRHALDGRTPVPGPRLVLRGAGATPLEDGLVIGRSRTAGLRLRVPEVSREHASVIASEDGWTIVDRSKNGLVVNGVRVRGAALRAGDEVVIGPARLRVEAASQPGGCPATAEAPDGGGTSGAPPRPDRTLRRIAVAAALALAAALAALAALW